MTDKPDYAAIHYKALNLMNDFRNIADSLLKASLHREGSNIEAADARIDIALYDLRRINRGLILAGYDVLPEKAKANAAS